MYEDGGGCLFVTSMGGVTASKLAQHRIDLVVSLETLSEPAAHELVIAQRANAGLRHALCPVLDQVPKYWSENDHASAKRAMELTLSSVRQGKRVLTHCIAGMHRSPALAIAVVSVLANVSLDAASRMVHSKRARSMSVPDTARGFADSIEAT